MTTISQPGKVTTDDGVNLAYQVHGSGTHNLLFMHGWAGSSGYFDPFLDSFDLTDLRAITYDYRGHGASDKTEDGYTLDRFAADALTVAAAVEARKFIVVAFSMGGKFAQYLACAYPEHVSGLILIAGTPAAVVPFPADLHLDWINSAGKREKLIAITRMFTSQPVSEEILDRFGDDAVRVPRVALDETLAMATQLSFSERLDGLRVPTLIIGGAHDAIFTPDVLCATMVAPISGARLALVDANHEIPIERPLELGALIQAFLAGVHLV